MIEQGLVQFIQAGLGSIAPGGWAVQLPKDQISEGGPRAWTYHSVTAPPPITLDGQGACTKWNVVIDSHGYTMADAIYLSRLIEKILRGATMPFTLPDPDSTVVQAVFRASLQLDGFNDLNRSFVRSHEYAVIYNQT